MAGASRESSAELTWFGLLVLAFFALLAAVAWLRFDAVRLAAVLLSVGGGVAAAYYAVRPLRRPLLRAWTAAFQPLGWAVSQLVLAIVYFGIVTPVALALRLVKDPMRRRAEPDAASYWTAHRHDDDVERYFRQS